MQKARDFTAEYLIHNGQCVRIKSHFSHWNKLLDASISRYPNQAFQFFSIISPWDHEEIINQKQKATQQKQYLSTEKCLVWCTDEQHHQGCQAIA